MQRSTELAINSEVAFVDLRFTRALNFEKKRRARCIPTAFKSLIYLQ